MIKKLFFSGFVAADDVFIPLALFSLDVRLLLHPLSRTNYNRKSFALIRCWRGATSSEHIRINRAHTPQFDMIQLFFFVFFALCFLCFGEESERRLMRVRS